MALPDVSSFVGCCKDFLHAEWANYKKTGVAKSCPICIYSIGGEDDIPASCLESIGNGFTELEKILRDVVYLSVDVNTPVIKEDVMVWANGQITVFPPRKSEIKEPVPAPSTANELPPPPIAGKKKKPQTPEAAFMGGVEQVSNYMLDHLKRISEACFLAGNMKVLYYVLASCILIKSRMMTYKQVLKAPHSNNLTTAVNRCNETIEVMTQHLLNYHSDLIRSCILHDASSHDWMEEKSYEENEKVSLCIQMWSFYMQGIHNDLWRYSSTKVGENIFSNIFVDTLGLLVTRYVQAKPSDLRLHQMRGDIAAIFLITASFLPTLVSSPRFFFRGDIHNSLVFSFHRRMDLLLRVAAIKCSPIETLAKVYSSGIHARDSFSVNTKEPTEIVSCPSWLTFFNSSIFPSDTRQLSTLPDSVAVYLTLLNAAMRPFPDESLIVRGLFMRKLLATKTILRGLQDLQCQVDKGASCGGSLCLGHLCTPPVIPHTVYSAIVQILIETFKSPHLLASVVESGIKESVNWDALDRKQVWNIQRPPWHHALVHLMGLYVSPVVYQVLQSLPAEPPAQPPHPSQLSIRLEHHLSAWTLQLINGVANLTDTIPLSLIQLAHSINSFLPPTIKPVGGHLISQLVISAIYSIVNSRTSLDQLCASGSITDGQWDMMIAVGERLCSLHDGNYSEGLEQMTKALLEPLSTAEEVEDENIDDYTNEETIEEVCQQLADHVMCSEQGKHSFGMVWEYLKRNMEWIAYALKAPPLLPPPPSTPADGPRLAPPKMSFTKMPQIYNPLKYYKRIFYTRFNHNHLMSFEGKWESVLKGDLWMPEDMIRDLIKQRPEMQKEAVLSTTEAEAVETLTSHLK